MKNKIGRKWNIKFWRLLIIPALFIILFADAATAEMHIMSDKALEKIAAFGIYQFALSDDMAMASLDIEVSTYTEIDSLKLGYYDDGNGMGWDENWTNVQIGSDSNKFVIKNVYIKITYDNIHNSTLRSLRSIKIGSTDMTGSIVADFNSFSGRIASTINGHRITPDFCKITFNNTGGFILLEMQGDQQGYSVNIDNATTTN